MIFQIPEPVIFNSKKLPVVNFSVGVVDLGKLLYDYQDVGIFCHTSCTCRSESRKYFS